MRFSLCSRRKCSQKRPEAKFLILRLLQDFLQLLSKTIFDAIFMHVVTNLALDRTFRANLRVSRRGGDLPARPPLRKPLNR